MKSFKYGLLGERLSHSYSKIIHNLFGNSEYELLSVDAGGLDRLLSSRDFLGLNVTIPYKKTVIPYCDELSNTARAVGCVNTLVVENGRLIGHNTDYAGFSEMARRAGIIFHGARILILGSGGTSLTARAVAAAEGAKEIAVVSRSGRINYANLGNFSDWDILINTTPVGMFPENGKCLVKLRDFTSLKGVIDVIYNPLRTGLLFDAEDLGIPHTNGLSMLVWQAKYAHELFLGTKLSEADAGRVLLRLERDMSNAVLVGMPGCGKTRIGKRLAEKLGRVFIDTDAEIEKKAGRPIPEIFAADGEEAFRRLESEAVREAGKRSGAVIATGGGAVTRPENYRPLKQNGTVFFIERPLSLLEVSGRPLSLAGGVEDMYARRLPLYLRFADKTIKNASTVEAAAEKIASYFR
jgi:shikimate dehydrogenase